MQNDAVNDLLDKLDVADGGIAMTIKEFAEAQYGIPLNHYCLQYLLGSTGLRYGAFYLMAGKPKSLKSPFVFYLLYECCKNAGIGYLYELEGKASPTLLTSMFADKPEWVEPGAKKSPFKLIKDFTLNMAEEHLVKKVLPQFRKAKAYGVPLCIDWDSISGSSTDDVVDKIESDGTASKGFYDKAHVMKYFSESWSRLSKNLPVVFVGVLQAKEKAEGTGPMMRTVNSYGGGSSQLFKAGTLLEFSFRKLQGGAAGKLVTIKTAMSGFSDDRRIDVKFTWNQFGNLEEESQGHKWCFAEASAQCLANPVIVGDLRDIVNVKIDPSGLVTCPQLDVTKVKAEEFEESLFSEEHKDILDQLYRYQKIEKIKPPDQYAEYVSKREGKEGAAKTADKEAAKAAKEAVKAAEAAKEAAKKARKEAKAKAQQTTVTEAAANMGTFN